MFSSASKIIPTFCAISLLFQTVSGEAAAREEDETTQFVHNWLKIGPMAQEGPFKVTFVERSLSSMYRVDRKGASPVWVKFRPFQLSQGSYYPKSVEGPFSWEKYELGKIRREHARELIEEINAVAKKVLIVPYAEGFSESVVEDKNAPYFLRSNVVTFWKHAEGTRNPYCQSNYLWDPSEYPTHVVGELADHLYQISTIANDILSKKQNPDSLKKALAPEYGTDLSEKALLTDLFDILGIGSLSLAEIDLQIDDLDSPLHRLLKEKATEKLLQIEEKKQKIARELKIFSPVSLNELADRFLKEFLSNHKKALIGLETNLEKISFLRAVFHGERQGIWNEETYHTARLLAQLLIAQDIALDICEKKAFLTKNLLKQLRALEGNYKDLEKAPTGFVQGNAHPLQFFLTDQKKWVLLDNDKTSVQFFLRDLSVEFVGKIVDAHFNNRIDDKKALELLKAVLIPKWVKEHGLTLLSCYILDFSQEARSLFYAYSLDDQYLPNINLTITLSSFIDKLEKRRAHDEHYRKNLYPAVESKESW